MALPVAAPQRADTPADGPSRSTSPDGRRQAARLSIAPELFKGSVDGAWWPRSQDVVEELGSLAAAFPSSLGRMTRVALPVAGWPGAHPWTVRREGPALHVGWFASMRPD